MNTPVSTHTSFFNTLINTKWNALQNKVLDLEKTKTTQHNEIASLKRRVKKLEKKNRSRTYKLKRLYKVGLTTRVESSRDKEILGEDASKHGRINAIDADEEITLVSVQDDADKEMFDVDALNGEEVFVAGQNENVVEEVVDAAQVSTAATTVTITTKEITLAQALEALKTSKPKVKGIVFQEPGKSTTTTTTISSQQSQDKGKGIMIEEPVKPMKKKDQISFDEEVALKLQAEFDEEERLAREKAEKEKEANIALIETWDDIQAKIDVDYQLAERLQAQEQEELSIEETTSGGGPWCQETMGDTIAQTRFENVSKHSNDSLLARGNILQSDGDRLKLDELMALCTTLQNRVLDLEKTKTTQHNEIANLKRRVKKLEKKNRSRTHKLKRLYKVGLTGRVESSDNEEHLDEEMFDVNVLDGGEVFVVEQEVVANKKNDEVHIVEEVVEVINTAKLITDAAQVSVAGNVVSTAGDATTVSAATTTTATITTVDDITLAQALMEIKSTKPKEKGVVIQELGESTTTISSQLSSQQSQDKGKGILIEPVKPMKKKDLIRLDEEAALKLQAEFDKEERLAREKAKKEKEANIALIETWDDIQAKIDADHQLAKRLQAQEQEELSIKEKATLFQQLLEKRRKHFAAKRAEEKRNKPPTKAQQRKIIAFKMVNTFEDFRTELVEGKEKRARTKLIQEKAKKQKVEDDKTNSWLACWRVTNAPEPLF
ncbi:hypothetical protein Tco_1126470 [Tanacetum coccineum]